jgi:TonB family protein
MSTVHTQLAHAHFSRRDRRAEGVEPLSFLGRLLIFFIGSPFQPCSISSAPTGCNACCFCCFAFQLTRCNIFVAMQSRSLSAIRSVYLLVGLFFVTGVCVSHARAELSTRPALIGTGEDSLASLLKYPTEALDAGQTGMVQFNCDVAADGRASNVQIVAAPQLGGPFARAVEQAMKTARFEPARLEGKAVAVTVPVTVLFLTGKEQPVIAIYLNHSIADVEAKKNYIARQPLLDQPYRPDYPIPADRAGRGGRIEVSYCLDTDGRMKDLKVLEETPAGYGFAASVTDALRKARYIPAFRDGKPIKECGEFVSEFEGAL